MRVTLICLLLSAIGCSGSSNESPTKVRQENPSVPSNCHKCAPMGECPYEAEAVLDHCGCLVRCKAAPKFEPVFKQGFHACVGDAAFSFAYTRRVQVDAKDSRLQKAIWRNTPKNYVPVSPTDPNISDAMCYASGPHRGLNLANWCCRAPVEQ